MIISFGVVGLVFATIGGVLLGYSESVVEVSQRYDNLVAVGAAGFVEIPIVERMEAPVFVYYELTNFYQNHRRYVASRDDDQLAAGDGVKTGSAAYSTNCDPWYESSYVAAGKTTNYQLYPCGLIARSVFNDTLTVGVRRAGASLRESLPMDDSAATISWPQDVSTKFHQASPSLVPQGASKSLIETLDMWLLKSFPPQVCLPVAPGTAPAQRPVATRVLDSGMEVADCDFSLANPVCNFQPACDGAFAAVANPAGFGINNAHFINWMRTAGLSTFRKLYAKVDTTLERGDVLSIGVQANFPVQSFQGTKAVVLSTATWAGGKNAFLGITYLVVGGLSLAFTAAYAWLHLKRGRRMVEIDYLDWGESQ